MKWSRVPLGGAKRSCRPSGVWASTHLNTPVGLGGRSPRLAQSPLLLTHGGALWLEPSPPDHQPRHSARRALENWHPHTPFPKWSKIKQAASRVTDLDLKKIFSDAKAEEGADGTPPPSDAVSFDNLSNFRHTFITLVNIDFRNNASVGGDIT